MRDQEIRRLTVVDAAGAVVGVLSHGALVQATGGEGAGRQATLGVTEGPSGAGARAISRG